MWNGYLTYKLNKIENSNQSTNEAKITVLNGVLTNITELVNASESKIVKVKSFKNDVEFREGSGIVYKQIEDGVYIVTSEFIVDGSSSVTVEFANGALINGNIIGSDIESGVSVILVKPDFNVEYFYSNNYSNSRVGEYILSLGFKSYSNAVSFGIITGLNNSVGIDLNSDSAIDWKFNMLQSDATINNDNNGGAMLNLNGELIGLNLTRVSSEFKNIALSREELFPIVEKIIETGNLQRVYLGIDAGSIYNMSSYEKSNFGISLDTTNGVYLSQVQESSPLAKAGLKVGDIILSINGFDVTDIKSYYDAIYKLNAQEKIKIVYNRNNETLEVEVEL